MLTGSSLEDRLLRDGLSLCSSCTYMYNLLLPRKLLHPSARHTQTIIGGLKSVDGSGKIENISPIIKGECLCTNSEIRSMDSLMFLKMN